MGPHTELEQVLLGVVGKFGPMTAYAVRKHFAESPSSSFSSSAGSIYPALERLEAARLVRARPGLRGRQPRRLFTLTAAGRRAVLAWLASPLEPEALEAPPDPIRTRLYFLRSLPRAKRARFLDETLASLAEQVERLQRYERGYPAGEVASRLASRGMTAVTRARLAWLRSARDELLAE